MVSAEAKNTLGRNITKNTVPTPKYIKNMV